MKISLHAKRARIALLGLAILSLAACSGKQQKEFSSGEVFENLPRECTSVVVLPSHQRSMRHLFGLAVYFFGEEAVYELKNTLFKNLANETGIDLLSPASLEKNGFSSTEPIVFAGNGKGGYYLSLPLVDALLAERFAQQTFGLFTDAEEEREEMLSGILSANRLYLILGMHPVGLDPDRAIDDATLAELGGLLQDIDSAPLIASARIDNASLKSFLGGMTVAGRSSLRITSAGQGLEIDVKSTSALFNLFALAGGALPFPLYAGPSIAGTALAAFFSPQDLVTVSFTMDFATLWQRNLRGMLYSQIERATKSVADNPLALLLSGGKPIAETVMSALDIENSVLKALTGRAGVVLRSLKDFSPLALSRVSSWNSLDGAIVLETRGADNARAVLQHLGGLSALPTAGELEIQLQNEGGAEFISFAAHRRYRLPILYLARAGRFLCLGMNKDSVLALSRQGEGRGNLAQLFGEESAGILTQSAHDFTLRVSLSALYNAVTATLDGGTKRNLEPFSAQLKKVQSLSLVRARNAEGGFRVLARLHFAESPPEFDPFEDSAGESDPLLIILGAILAAVFVIPLLFLIVRRIRYR